MLITLIGILISYLLGSIPSGIIVARLFNLGEIRDIGSGSTGATNVFRTGNYFASGITFIVDALKALIAIKICQSYYPDIFILCVIFILIGHIFPIWLKNFSGGKGYASFLGILLASSYILFFIIITSWIVVFAITRISSLSALLSIIILFVTVTLLPDIKYVEAYYIAGLIILISHAKNILRLITGKEELLK
jgi:glycerol-3-phosphate acyltransferase PlsY